MRQHVFVNKILRVNKITKQGDINIYETLLYSA